jgi:hypothetical protein
VDAAGARERLRRWGEAGRDRVQQRFSIDRMADAYSRVLLGSAREVPREVAAAGALRK